ncbi:MAG: hypothetical protein RLZZ597_1364 [Cyanobacteriota bacterium]|jgi:hypothetical protein
MGVRNYLTLEENQELQKPLKFHENPDLGEQILMLLLRNGHWSLKVMILDFLSPRILV